MIVLLDVVDKAGMSITTDKAEKVERARSENTRPRRRAAAADNLSQEDREQRGKSTVIRVRRSVGATDQKQKWGEQEDWMAGKRRWQKTRAADRDRERGGILSTGQRSTF